MAPKFVLAVHDMWVPRVILSDVLLATTQRASGGVGHNAGAGPFAGGSRLAPMLGPSARCAPKQGRPPVLGKGRVARAREGALPGKSLPPKRPAPRRGAGPLHQRAGPPLWTKAAASGQACSRRLLRRWPGRNHAGIGRGSAGEGVLQGRSVPAGRRCAAGVEAEIDEGACERKEKESGVVERKKIATQICWPNRNRSWEGEFVRQTKVVTQVGSLLETF
jgi:hypothetical protein